MKTNSAHKKTADDEALFLFNDIKDTYAMKIEDLTELKKAIFKSDTLDSQLKSKIRIIIESLLIDLNEEIFSISEELAKSYTFERQKNLLSKAREFDQRRKILMKKIQQSIDDNTSVKTVRRNLKILQHSPPQKEFNTIAQVESPSKNQESPKGFTQQLGQHQPHNLSEIFPPESYPRSQRNLHSKQYSNKKGKSPTPLRRKDLANQSFQGENRRASMQKVKQQSAKKQLFPKEGSKDERPTQRKEQQTHKTQRQRQKLEEFEKYLEKKKGKENLKKYSSENIDNNLQQNSTILQSEAFEQFSSDFNLMKNKILSLTNRLKENEEKTTELKDEVEKLKTENLKLTTDVKIIRNEQSEVLHSLYALEKKNSQLQSENQALKRMVQGEREMKGQESNMPKPYLEPNPTLTSANEQRLSKSPFQSALNKNRSFSQLRDSRDSSQNEPIDRNQGRVDQNEIHIQNMDGNSAIHSFDNVGSIQQQHTNTRTSLRQWPPIQPVEREKPNQSFSYQRPQPIARTGAQSSTGRDFYKPNETPYSPLRNKQLIDETPSQYRGGDERGRQQRSFLQSKKATPPSQSKLDNSNQLSDWVLERIQKKIN